MKRAKLIFVAIILSLNCLCFESKFFGFNFLNGQWSSEYKYDSETAYQSLLNMINQTSSNAISLTFCWYQRSVDVPGPIYIKNGTTPTDQAILNITSAAKKLGMYVLWRPCVDPDWNYPQNGTWRGEIGRYFSESDWDAWFGNYTEMIVHYAQLAQQAKIDQYSVGLELSIVQQQEGNCRSLVQKVKNAYSIGSIVYASNWDSVFKMNWWDAVDIISVDAYYPLAISVTNGSVPTLSQLLSSWNQQIKPNLTALAIKYQKKLTFSEIAYESCVNAHLESLSQCNGTISFDEQNVLFQALLKSWIDEDVFEGMFIWAWVTSDIQNVDPQNCGFGVNNKPAAAIIKNYFQQYPRTIVKNLFDKKLNLK